MKSILICLCSVLSLAALGQEIGYLEGFIVTNNNDTIHGLVKNKNLVPFRILENIKFKNNKDDKPKIYSPIELKFFQAGTNQYVSRKLKFPDGSLSQSFLEVLIDGEMSHYELRVTLPGVGSELVYQILQRKNEEALFSVYREKFKERLLDFMKNDPEFIQKINDGIYKRKNIEDMVNDYNLKKFTPKISRKNNMGPFCFFGFVNSEKANLQLTINDTLQFNAAGKFLINKMIPADVKTKICFGNTLKKECILISSLPFYPLTNYYLLEADASKNKFSLKKKSQKDAQQLIYEFRSK